MRQKLSSKIRELYKELPENFTITHHTGALNKEMNSLESVKFSLKYGADIIEVDVSFRPSLIPVIIHKNKPDENEGILFEEAVKIIAADSECRMNLDLKSVVNLPEIDKIIKKYNMVSRVFYTGVTEDWVPIVKEKSVISYYLIYKLKPVSYYNKGNSLALAKKIKELGAIGLNTNFSNAGEILCSVMRNEGLLISLWTVNDIKEIKRVLLLNPDNITTKRPDNFESLCDPLNENTCFLF